MNTSRTFCVAALLLVTGGAAFAHDAAAHADHGAPPAFDAAKVEDTPFGRAGDPKKVTRTIQVRMSDTMRFTPAALTLRRGQTVRFVVHNDGQLLHEMVLGTADALAQHAALMRRFPEMEHAEPQMAHVKPGATGEIVWQFTRPGEFRFACLQPGHYEAGMAGRLTVK